MNETLDHATATTWRRTRNGSTVLEPIARGLQYRHLVRNLVARDLKVRYRGSLLGFAWTFLNPLLMTLIFSVVLTRFLRVPDVHVPFPAFFLVGLLPWNFCVAAVMGSLVSIIGNASIVGKVHFPRTVLPLSVALSGAVNFLLALLVLQPVLWVFGIRPSWALAFFPLVMAAQLLFLAGLGLILAVMNVFFRDTAPIVEVLLQAWFFLTPVIYDLDQAMQPFDRGLDVARAIEIINPMASIITLYRQVLLYGMIPDIVVLGRTLLIALGVLAVGYVVFKGSSGRIGDEL